MAPGFRRAGSGTGGPHAEAGAGASTAATVTGAPATVTAAGAVESGGPLTTSTPAIVSSATESGFDAKSWLTRTTADVRETFARKRLLVSFGEYFSLFGASPARHVRSAAQYLRDVFDHFGTVDLSSPRGPLVRWRLFDVPWENGKDALMGQEEVQAA